MNLLFSIKDQYPIPMATIISQISLKRMQQLYDKQNEQDDTIEQTIGTSLKMTKEDEALEEDYMEAVPIDESTTFDGNE